MSFAFPNSTNPWENIARGVGNQQLPSDPYANNSGPGWQGAANAIASGLNGGAPNPATTIASGLPAPPPPSTAARGQWGGNYGNPSTGATNYASGAGGGATWNPDGSYTLPSGEKLGAGNTFTLGVGGQQVRVAGNYNGSNQALWQNNGVGETAMDRFSRRLNDLAATGANVNDPNVQYDTMARVRDDASAALQQRLGRPPTAQELQQATGFAHIDRFVRGQNGEQGFTNNQGQQGQGMTNPPPGGPGASTVTSGGSASGAPASDAAWQAAISSATGTPPATTPSTPSAAGAPPVSASGLNPGNQTTGSGGSVQSQVLATKQATPNGVSYYGQAPSEIIDTPEYAYRAIMERMGMNPDIHGAFNQYLQQHLTNAFGTILKTMQGAGQMPADFNGVLDQIGQQAFGQGGNWQNYTGQIANQGLQRIAGMGNADMSTVAPEIQNLLALKATGYNPVATSDMLNTYKQTMGQYMDQGLQNGGADKQSFMPYLLGTNFGQRYMTGQPLP